MASDESDDVSVGEVMEIGAHPLRLEWRDPAELDDNPANWRVHPDNQLRALEDVIREVGFADALLFNERTGRLLDGHARKKVARPGEKVPVLVGSWTEAQEKVILATLDTSTAMAKANPDALDALLQDISLSSHDMLNFLEEVSRNAQSEREDEDQEDAEELVGMEQMALLPYEHYDYILILARNINDWNYLQELCGLKRVNSCPIQGKKKIVWHERSKEQSSSGDCSMQYKVVVPSRRRETEIARLLKLIPKATICVDEGEMEAYGPHVPKEQLWPHPSARCIGEIRDWIVQNADAECVVMIDDDLRHVMPMIGTRRQKITDPRAIERILHNSVQICTDVGIKLFGWSRSPNPALTLGHDPIRFCAPCMGAVGVVGKLIRYDRGLTYGEDIDLTMKHLLRHRIVYIDNRFYFDFGKAWGNKGGLQGIRTSEVELSDRKRLQERWGRYVRLGEKTAAARAGQHAGRSTSASIRVKRK